MGSVSKLAAMSTVAAGFVKSALLYVHEGLRRVARIGAVVDRHADDAVRVGGVRGAEHNLVQCRLIVRDRSNAG